MIIFDHAYAQILLKNRSVNTSIYVSYKADMNRICNLDLKLKLKYSNTLRFIKKTDWQISSNLFYKMWDYYSRLVD